MEILPTMYVCGIGGWATNYFEDVGHSADARQIMKKYCIGRLAKVSNINLADTPRSIHVKNVLEKNI